MDLNRLDFINVVRLLFNNLVLNYFRLEEVGVVYLWLRHKRNFNMFGLRHEWGFNMFGLRHKGNFNLLVNLRFRIVFTSVLDNNDLRMHI